MMASDVIFTNSAGIHGPAMAETVLAMILHFGRSLDRAVAAQARCEWDREAFVGVDSAMVELSAATVGIIGFGGIGREVARRVAALGARVVALDRESVTLADPPVEVLQGSEGLLCLLAESDYVIVAAPDTEETRGMVDRETLARVKEGAVVINVSRGSIVDEEALLEALESGRLRGAALDVFTREPLSQASPLWSMENVLITPHVSAVTPLFWRRQTDLIVENLRRFVAGQELRKVVDKEAGF
jgi:phosphoglycerate dehydrogenase-like enzyme